MDRRQQARRQEQELSDLPASETPSHDGDLHAWAIDQARRLRAATRGGTVEGIDYEKIALTLDLLARAEREAVRDAMRQLLLNALKLRYSGDERARRLWELGAADATRALGERMGASLYTHVLDHLGELYAEARRVAAADLEGHGEFDAASRLPHTCPWTTEELLRE